MQIYNELEILWEGETYSVKPTLQLIQDIESKKGFSIGNLYYRHSQGDLPLSMVAECYQKILTYAGVNVTADEVYQAFYGAENDFIMSAVNAFFMACFPNSKDNPKPSKKKSQNET